MSEENLVRFCLINKNGQPYEIIDSAIADEVINSHEIIIMAGQPWIYEGGVYRKDDKGLHIQDYVKKLDYKKVVYRFKNIKSVSSYIERYSLAIRS